MKPQVSFAPRPLSRTLKRLDGFKNHSNHRKPVRLFPLPKGEGQGEGKGDSKTTHAIKPARRLIPLARNLRKQDTWAEKLLWSWLRDRRFSAYKFRWQHTFGTFILDFFCVEAGLNIELDGSQHGLPEQKEKDEIRDAWLANAGVKVLRFWNARLRREKETVREIIWHEPQMRAPRPLPDYCRPLGQPAEIKPDAPGHATPTFPSPLPSPSGRGRNVTRLTQKLVIGLAEPTAGKFEESAAPVLLKGNFR